MTGDLAVLVYEFPKLSETFVVSDLLALEARGVRLHLFALRQSQSDLTPASFDQLRAKVEYLPDIRGRQLQLLLRATHLTPEDSPRSTPRRTTPALAFNRQSCSRGGSISSRLQRSTFTSRTSRPPSGGLRRS
jgi:hypothetical protein